jgi:hypothetical protein
MRWAAAFKSRLTQGLGVSVMGLAAALVLAGPALVAVYMYRSCTLIDEGLVAQGVIVGGEAGVSPGDAYYCVEEISFTDHLGKPRKTQRSCANDPEIGEKVTVRYSASDPSKTYVDGDNKFAGLVFWLLILGFWVFWKLLQRLFKDDGLWPPLFRDSPPRPRAEPEPVWNASAAEEFRRLGPVYPRSSKPSG